MDIPCRTIREAFGLCARHEALSTPEFIVEREHWVPSQSRGECEVGVDAPGILNEAAPPCPVQLLVFTATLVELVHLAQHEIGECITADVDIEVEQSHCAEMVFDVVFRAQNLA